MDASAAEEKMLHCCNETRSNIGQSSADMTWRTQVCCLDQWQVLGDTNNVQRVCFYCQTLQVGDESVYETLHNYDGCGGIIPHELFLSRDV